MHGSSSAASAASVGSAEALDVVLLTGTIPNPSGIGVERRAAETLQALAELGRVHVVHVGTRASRAIVPDPMRGLSSSWQVLPSRTRLDLGRWLRRLYLRVPGAPAPPMLVRARLERAVELEGACEARLHVPKSLLRADYVHAFRLPQVPLLEPWRARGVRVGVDLDDLESDTLGALADLAAANGEGGLSWTYRSMAEAALRYERRWLPSLRRIAVASQIDQARVHERFPHAHVEVLPNVYARSEQTPAFRARPRPLRLLLVGALAYYPNLDGLRFAVREILPRLRDAGMEAQLHVVGRGHTRTLRRELSSAPEVVYHGEVAALGPHYAQATVALCPVRAGGGSRIKILEAFAHRVPVVATTAGAAGLAVQHGRELLIADDPGAFVHAIARLAQEEHARAIVDRAYAFVLGHHQRQHFAAAIRSIATA